MPAKRRTPAGEGPLPSFLQPDFDPADLIAPIGMVAKGGNGFLAKLLEKLLGEKPPSPDKILREHVLPPTSPKFNREFGPIDQLQPPAPPKKPVDPGKIARRKAK